MPYPLIPTALGVCFVVVWVLVGGMIFRDSQLAARSEHDAGSNILPLIPRRPTEMRRTATGGLVRQSTVRAAS